MFFRDFDYKQEYKKSDVPATSDADRTWLQGGDATGSASSAVERSTLTSAPVPHRRYAGTLVGFTPREAREVAKLAAQVPVSGAHGSEEDGGGLQYPRKGAWSSPIRTPSAPEGLEAPLHEQPTDFMNPARDELGFPVPSIYRRSTKELTKSVLAARKAAGVHHQGDEAEVPMSPERESRVRAQYRRAVIANAKKSMAAEFPHMRLTEGIAHITAVTEAFLQQQPDSYGPLPLSTAEEAYIASLLIQSVTAAPAPPPSAFLVAESSPHRGIGSSPYMAAIPPAEAMRLALERRGEQQQYLGDLQTSAMTNSIASPHRTAHRTSNTYDRVHTDVLAEVKRFLLRHDPNSLGRAEQILSELLDVTHDVRAVMPSLMHRYGLTGDEVEAYADEIKERENVGNAAAIEEKEEVPWYAISKPSNAGAPNTPTVVLSRPTHDFDRRSVTVYGTVGASSTAVPRWALALGNPLTCTVMGLDAFQELGVAEAHVISEAPGTMTLALTLKPGAIEWDRQYTAWLSVVDRGGLSAEDRVTFVAGSPTLT